MTQKQWKSRTASIIIALAALGAINLPQLANAKAIAQTPSVEPLCTETNIKQYIQQLNEFKNVKFNTLLNEFEESENVNFNALVACNSKAVPALIKALENQDENFRIITIAALGEIGTKAAPAVPLLTKSLEDTSKDVRVMAVHALQQIGQNPVRPLIQALKSKNLNIRYRAAETLGQFGIEARYAVPPLLKTALKDTSAKVSHAAVNAVREINAAIIIYKSIDIFEPVYCSYCSDTDGVSRQVKKRLSANSPVMCRIPAIGDLLRWKCPRVQRVNNNGR
ncbi:HEAT repeat domain-containing protein [Nostoc sp.]|uniref:HEAT repeat domain-containing protein n=1 Tax=Nostoc sp. TaxID=1180 RepID=UPI002FFB6A72